MSTRTTSYTTLSSAIGTLVLTGDGDALTGLYIERPPKGIDATWREDAGPFRAVLDQLSAYFAGDLREFDVDLAPAGTDFQQAVWQELRAIPYAGTRSYGFIANAIGRPSASRAVGMANGRNPISIIVPCHRVIGSTGMLTGYGGGIDRKRVLLDLERTGLAATDPQLSLI